MFFKKYIKRELCPNTTQGKVVVSTTNTQCYNTTQEHTVRKVTLYAKLHCTQGYTVRKKHTVRGVTLYATLTKSQISNEISDAIKLYGNNNWSRELRSIFSSRNIEKH